MGFRTEVPQQGPGADPWWGLRASPQKLMTKETKERQLQRQIETTFYVRCTLIIYKRNKQKCWSENTPTPTKNYHRICMIHTGRFGSSGDPDP